TDYDSADESLVCSTPLLSLKKLDGVEPVFRPKTIKSILKSKSPFKAETLKGITINEPSSASTRGKSSSASKTNSAPAASYWSRIISLRRGINPRNPQHVTKNCKTCGSNIHTTSDHNDIEWFRKIETLQAKNVSLSKQGLTYKGYLDSDYAKCNMNKKSTSGLMIMMITIISLARHDIKPEPSSFFKHQSRIKKLKKFDFITEDGRHIHLTEEEINHQKKLEEDAKDEAAKQKGEVRKAELVDLLGPEVVKRTGKGWETIYKQIGTRMDYIHTIKEKLGINLNITLSKQDPLDKLIDLTNKKRKHADDIHDYFKANKSLKSSVLYKDYFPGIVLNDPVLASFTIHSESALGCDGSLDSTTKANPRVSAPSDFVPQQQDQTKFVSEGLENVLTQPIIGKGASSIARKLRKKPPAQSSWKILQCCDETEDTSVLKFSSQTSKIQELTDQVLILQS
nr:hypothetical protein [Tanacetum cinerariifolium]